MVKDKGFDDDENNILSLLSASIRTDVRTLRNTRFDREQTAFLCDIMIYMSVYIPNHQKTQLLHNSITKKKLYTTFQACC